jgi:hypothetical protein
MQPRRRDGVDLQRFEGKGAQDLVEIGGKERIEDVPSSVIMEGGACEPWLEQVQHAPLCQPLPHFIEGMRAIQKREHEGLDPTASREHMRWVGRDEAVDHSGHLQAP